VIDESESRLKHLRQAFVDTPSADPAVLVELHALQDRLNDIKTRLEGDRTLAEYEEPVPTSISRRVRAIVSDQWSVTSAPTQSQIDGYEYAADEFTALLAELAKFVHEDLVAVEQQLEAAGAPWTPGRLPTWEKE
jgi:hypothetical protein